MMILSGLEIQNRLNKDIIIEPFCKKQLNPNSYNLKLHNRLQVYYGEILDVKKSNSVINFEISEQRGFLLEPNKIYLGKTVEYTETHNLVPMLEGRSSLGRLGIFIHVTAGFGDVGFCGNWTLEITVTQPTIIFPFIEVAQIYYHTLEGKYKNYSGKYQNQKDIKSSLLYKEFKEKK